MTTQHTPGPWQYDEIGIIYSGDCAELCARHSNDHVVALLMDACPDDARLIAAAPALLEALMEAADLIETHFPKKMARSARVAIRAATGEDA